jgi:short-subunit dehydrogenase
VSPTALITGASSGIGMAFTDLLARDRYDLVLVARNVRQLDDIAASLRTRYNVTVQVLPADLSRPGAPDAIMQALEAGQIHVDLLINNAGSGLLGPFIKTDLATELAMIQVNVVALTALTKHLVRGMVARRHGRILNVASTAAFQPGPLMAVYYASKAYVLSFSQALANELVDTGVTVTALCPGPTRTGFQARAGLQDARLVKGPMMNSARVAEAGYRGMLEGRRIVIPGLSNKLLVQLNRLAPRALVTAIVRWIQESRKQD